MTTTRQILGTSGRDTLTAGAADELIYGYAPAATGPIRVELLAGGFDQPLFATAPPGDTSSLYVVEKTGRIVRLDLGDGSRETFLDVSAEVSTEGEAGLLGLAFHPDYAENGHFYLHLTNLAGDSEFRAYPGGDVLLELDHPDIFGNHFGGWLGFGPDNLLYAAIGDGGGAGDPLENAQNLDSLMGKIVRLDVASDGFPDDSARDYAIPDDNPFGNEVWALGLRNPWRAGFDQATGDFYIADVGEKTWEEVNLGERGANYGWDLFEGPARFEAEPGQDLPALTAPLHAYGHDVGQSIIGGTVYRGPAEAFQGQYFFADFVSGRLWTLDGQTATERTGELSHEGSSRLDNPTSFGEDGRGNLVVTDQDGDVFLLVPGNLPDGADIIDAAAGDDVVFGGAGGDTLRGGAGNDLLRGQSGADVLIGGAGADRMEGGPGNDRFVVADGDVVVDFTPGADRIVLPSQAAIRAQAGGTVLAFGDDTVTLESVAPASLQPSDFVLA